MTSSSWKQVGSLAPTALSEARVQLHWAAQPIAAVGDAMIPRRADDSQSNFGWSDARGALMSHSIPSGLYAGLCVRSFSIVLLDSNEEILERKALEHETLAAALDWLRATVASRTGTQLDAKLQLRDYDMPSHPVNSGAPFSLADPSALSELALWFENGFTMLREIAETEATATSPRCWPHHFDIGSLILLDPELGAEAGRSVGVGLSPGDSTFPEPYFYVSPYPRPSASSLPALAGGGTWHREGFFAAVLTGSSVDRTADGGAQYAQVAQFLRSACTAARALLE